VFIILWIFCEEEHKSVFKNLIFLFLFFNAINSIIDQYWSIIGSQLAVIYLFFDTIDPLKKYVLLLQVYDFELLNTYII